MELNDLLSVYKLIKKERSSIFWQVRFYILYSKIRKQRQQILQASVLIYMIQTVDYTCNCKLFCKAYDIDRTVPANERLASNILLTSLPATTLPTDMEPIDKVESFLNSTTQL